MKFFTSKKVTQKIIIALVTVIVLNFSVPIQSKAISFTEIAGDLLQEIVLLVDAIGDVVMGALNKFMLGTDKIYGSAMLDTDDPNLNNDKSSLFAQNGPTEKDVVAEIPEDFEPDGLFMFDWRVPNFLYCPENIFANKIAALDVNFINQHKYTAVEYEEDSNGTLVVTPESGKKAESSAGGTLRNVIASWYKAFRNIAIVGLLIVLVYLGIRIMISSTAVDKAKYKQNLYDWLVALCLVVVIHFIMAGIMMFTDSFTNLLSDSVNKTIYIEADGVKFRTNLTGYVRFMAQSPDFSECTTYTIIYIVFVIYTCMFTFTYFRRFLYMAFFTMIAPLVAMTYPIDKIKDGKAQAFNLWFKEYTMNAIIQPVHLLLYTVFVGSAMDLAMNNPIYAIVAIGFLTPAEKFIKKMFGVESQTAGGLGELAGGALAYSGIQKFAKQLIGKNGKKENKSDDSGVGNNVLVNRGANASYNPLNVLTGGGYFGGPTGGGPTGGGPTGGGPTGGGPTGGGPTGGGPTGGGSTGGGPTGGDPTGGGPAGGDPTGGDPAGGDPTGGGPTGGDPTGGGPAGGDPTGGSPTGGDPTGGGPTGGEPTGGDPAGGDPTGGDPTGGDPAGGDPTGGDPTGGDPAGGDPTGGGPTGGGPTGGEPTGGEPTGGEPTGGGPTGGEPTGGEPTGGGPILTPGPTRPTRLDRVKRGTGAVLSSGKRAIRRATIDKVNTSESRRKTGKQVFKAVTRAGGIAAGATLLGTAGIAAGVATGDVSKGVSMALGATTLGASFGDSVAKRGNKVIDNVTQTYKEGAYSKQELKEMKHRQYDAEWKNKEENYKYLRKKGLNDKQSREFLNSDRTQAFLDAGITDMNLIYNASNLEDEHGNKYSTDHAVAVAKISSNLSDKYESDVKEQKAFWDNMKDKGFTNSMIDKLDKDIIKVKQ